MTVELPSDISVLDGEVIVSRQWANHTQSRFRAAGGRLYLTNRRVLFRPHAVDAALAGEYWHAPLTSITEIGKQKPTLRGSMNGGIRTRLRITVHDGTTELFVVNKLDRVIREIQSAIKSA